MIDSQRLAEALARRLAAVAPYPMVIEAAADTVVMEGKYPVAAEAFGVSMVQQEGDPQENLERACWSVLDGFQDYVSEDMTEPWPRHAGKEPLHKPFVQITDVEIRLGYGSPDAPVLSLPSIPLDEIRRRTSLSREPRSDVVRQAWILQGREPDWRMGWEEYLSPESRREVENAVKRGRAVEDDDLRMYAVGLARKSMRRTRWMVLLVPVHLAIVSSWIYFACVRPSNGSFFCWFWVVIGILWLTFVPFRFVTQYRRMATAERANSREP
jgi:hypothetical protein